MSDARRRELERQAATSGSPDDAARLLAERVRQGSVTEERLRLAALLGDPGARVLAGEPQAPSELIPWCLAVGAHGLEAAVRGGVAAARLVRPDDPAYAIYEAWLATGCDPARGQAAVAAARLASAPPDDGWWRPWGPFEAPEDLATLRDELLRETAPPNEPRVRDLEPFCRSDDDLAGFVVQDGRPTRAVAVVHLTWTGGPELPGWPMTSVARDLADWADRQLPHPQEVANPEPVRRQAIAWALAFVAAPGGLERATDRLAAGAMCAAHALEDARGERVRAAIAAALLPWALASTR